MISLLVPSRGRPGQLVQMWHSAISTAADPDSLELVVRLDEDDAELYRHLTRAGTRLAGAGLQPQRVRWVIKPRVNEMTINWNDAWEAARGDVFLHGADDIRFREPDWDLRVSYHFDRWTDRIGFVHGRDGAHDAKLGTHGFLSRQWTDAVGHFLPPYFSCDYADTWLNEVADAIGRRVYDPRIFTEHLHPALGKGQVDQTHRDRFARDERDNNTARWHSLVGERANWVIKLQAAIG